MPAKVEMEQGQPDLIEQVRGMLAKSVTEAARFISGRGVIKEGGPVLVRFITQVASSFGPTGNPMPDSVTPCETLKFKTVYVADDIGSSS